MLAVHGGAGCHTKSVDQSCSSALKFCNNNLNMEKDPLLNCGYGSNLTLEGEVECEAAYMCSINMAYGAVAALTNCINPIIPARELSNSYLQNSNWDLVPPMILVGKGANKYCQKLNIGITENIGLRSKHAKDAFDQANQIVHRLDRLDTVGGCQIESNGISHAGVSSGGIILKHSGRLGHSSHFGSAIWAEQRDSKSISIALSGCGEALTRTHLAEKLAEQFFNW